MTILQNLDAAEVSKEIKVNENFDTVSAAGIFGKRHPVTLALVWGYYGGRYNGNTIADGTVTLADDATNYVVVLRSTGVVSVSTSSTNSTDPLYARLYQLTTVDGVVTFVIDERWEANGLMLTPGSPATDIAAATHAASSKSTPVDADEFTGTDSASGYSLVHFTWANIKAGIFTALGALINGATPKTTPVNADAIAIMDSAASNATKSLTFTNLKAFLKTYFDTLYAAAGGASGNTVTALTISSGVVDIDLALGNYFTLALSANVTSFTYSNLPGSGKGFSIWIDVTQHASAAKTVTLSQFKRSDGATSAISTTLSAVDSMAITSTDNGTTQRLTLGKAWV